MAPSRKHSNGRSPLVNQQSQITAFFSKSSSSAATPSSKLSKPAPNPTPDPPSPGPATPSPVQTKSKKKPLLVIGGPTTPKPKTSSFGEEIVNKRVRVFYPLDKKWYEGRVASFHKLEGRHLVEYDDGEEEKLDLGKEKIELLEEEVQKKFKRLRKVSLVLEDNDEEEGEKEEHDEVDSEDEDWGEEKMEVEEDCDDVVEWDEEEEEVAVGKRKRTTSGGMKATESSNKSKTKCSSDNVRGGIKAKVDSNVSKSVEQKSITAEILCTGDKVYLGFDDAMVGDTSERFRMRETEKFRFLGKERRDANRRRPDDVDYDPKTLYLPPDFLKSLSCGQRQWWEFKSKHMDKVLFFKMGKFYELFEMDAHIGAKDLDLQYMRGEQPHCGFPEKNFSMNVEKLARKGYRVLVVEQTETPEQLELRRKEKGSKDKVVKREICAVVTKGTLTEGELQSANPDTSYLLAVTESCHISENKKEDRIFGVCVVDVATSRIILGQFEDNSECNGLSCLLSELRPVEIIKPAGLLNPETERVILRHTRNPLINELIPLMEFWDAERTVCEIKSIYVRINDQSLSGSLIEASFKHPNSDVKNGFGCLPDILSNLMSAGESGTYALSALGGTLSYLKQAFLDETLLRYAKFELLPSSGFCNISQKLHMVLDAAALENLEIFENNRNGDSSGTLYAQLNHCVTSFGKRLLKTWIARPLYHVNSIRERQDAVAGLKGINLPFSLDFRKKLARLPDMERLLSHLFSSSDAFGRHANKVVLYEDAAKKQLQEFISALRGCELMTEACSSLDSSLENVESSLLLHLLTVGRGLPDISSVIKHFRDAFDWAEANNSGRVIPHDGVDIEYDSACKIINEIDSNLKEHLKDQRKLLGEPSINYVTIGKDEYLLEIPEWLRGKVPRDYELRSSKKGYFRYWNPSIKKLLGELSQAESEKESKLKSILQRLIRKFCEYHNELRQLVSTTAELDVLISLAIASDYYEGPSCRPAISGVSSPNEVPFLEAKNLGHPVLQSDSLSNQSFVPNDIKLGGVGQSSFILLTGPNMGGKSTLLRQVCLSIILAQVGADVPADSFDLSPVDRIFVRMGATDHIMAGQSTFLTELSETASMLSSATRNSLVALDELGRGTSTSDGQAIAESVLEYFVHKVQCRGMFSTHYHRLAVDYQKDPKVFLCHMGCQVNGGDGGVEDVTFLYRIMPGACPKSYGVNVARLAGLPDSVLQKAAAKSLEFESMYGKHQKNSESKSKQDTENEMGTFVQKVMEVVATLGCCGTIDSTGINHTLTELQHGAKVLLLES